MSDIIKTVIYDFQELDLPVGTGRQLDVSYVPGKATICIGVRRGGKSTYMFQCIDKLIKQGVSGENIVYINFFDDRLRFLHDERLGEIVDTYYSIYPEKKNVEEVFYFFDEIQMCRGWDSFVDRLMRTEKCRVYITGSSAKMLSKEIATQMRGRSLSWEIFPFSFSEFLDHNNVDYTSPLTSRKQSFIKKNFEDFWQKGGFPEVANLDAEIRIHTHQEYFHAVLFRDLIERHNISHPKALSDLAYWFMDNIASMYTLNRLTNYLKSLGHKVPKNSVAEYIGWLEDAYFLFTVRMFDASVARANTNPKKVYCIDHSLVRSVSSGILLNSGYLLENLVFTHLRRSYQGVYYYKTNSGKEVDFIVQDSKRNLKLIQVAESIEDESTRKREITGLSEAMAEKSIKHGLIVTKDYQEKLEDSNGIIDIVPIWQFLF